MKDQERNEIERATAKFLADGGTVQHCTSEDNKGAKERPLKRWEYLKSRKSQDGYERANARDRRQCGE